MRITTVQHDEITWSDAPLIIDTALLPWGSKPYETMALRPGGAELEAVRSATREEAEQAHRLMLAKYTAPAPKKDAPKAPSKLTGKYAKLRDDLKAALEQTAHIEQDEDDGGTCNFDSPSLRLPRWNGKLIEQAAKEAGSSAFKWDLYGNIRWVFNPCSSGQGNRRSRRAEAITKVLRAMGYDAIDYCQAD